LGAVPGLLLIVFASDLWLALTGVGLMFLVTGFSAGPVLATIQMVAPPDRRARASAMHYFILKVVGFSIAPVLFGAISDILAATFDLSSGEGLRWAPSGGALVLLTSAVLFSLGRSSVREDARVPP
jgi:hypothetical protein